MAAPDAVASGPPVVYHTAADAPLVTATTFAAPTAPVLGQKQNRILSRLILHPRPIAIQQTLSARTPTYYAAQANAAQVPIGCKSAFTNTGASPNADNYLGFTLLSSYDVQTCANRCNAVTRRTSFNVYFERDPSVDPNDPSCDTCSPSSITNIKCVWWGSTISPPTMSTKQFRGNFEVASPGSNGCTGLFT
ncbi:hypothetical protein AC578_1456 [Pseudocercospora eumusae]|uniref:Apple domain-containing protein n=1 Tax=Pseudocercospora eumusae TaxID=321146 RepID=A0A139GUB9_9PEZI|nr:hypothetical protein AC578_1456 [Pseudocercospora eumusae]